MDEIFEALKNAFAKGPIEKALGILQANPEFVNSTWEVAISGPSHDCSDPRKDSDFRGSSRSTNPVNEVLYRNGHERDAVKQAQIELLFDLGAEFIRQFRKEAHLNIHWHRLPVLVLPLVLIICL